MIKKIVLASISILWFQLISAQQIDSILSLPSALYETSGLIYFNQKLITHTDSGGENVLYEIDSVTGQILRTVYIQNATNDDWEDISQDQNNIYIADFGNNLGNRTNLRIYKVDKLDYLNSSNDTVSASEISFSYENQSTFVAQNQNTNFDAEALLAFGDSLYILTKNWINQKTNVYRIPKIPGNFSAELIDSFNTEGLVTGAALNVLSNKIFLSGYTKLGSCFLFEMKDFNGSSFFSGTNTRMGFVPKGSVQIEGICHSNGNKYFMSSERFLISPSVLHQFIDTSNVLVIDSISHILTIENELILYPNPSGNKIFLDAHYDWFEFYNLQGGLVHQTNKTEVNIEKWDSGIYFVRFYRDKSLKKTVKLEKL